ncbi:MAG: hypothetical protein GC155_06270 [Alphaproteobacteria bacterium]|nr:hypothetical protein [Alphaproteobacteria bacterium]
MTDVTIPDEATYVEFDASSVGPHSFTFTYFDKTDLHVSIDGVELAQGDFSHTPDTTKDGGYDGGSITLNDAVADGAGLIWREVQTIRTTVYGAGPLSPQSISRDMTRDVAMAQDARRDIGRSAKVAQGSDGPVLEPEEGTVLGWVGGVLRNVALASVSVVAVATSWFVPLGEPLGTGWAALWAGPRSEAMPEQLMADRTIYVNHGAAFTDSDGNDWAAGGAGDLAGGYDAPYSTVTAAWKAVQNGLWLNGYNVVIQIADGTWDEIVTMSGPPSPGWRDMGSIIVRGNLDDEDACFNLHTGNYPCFSIYDAALVRVEGIKFSNPNALDHGFKVYRNAYCEIGQIKADDCALSCFQPADGFISVAARGFAAGWVKFDGDSTHGIVCEVANGGFDGSAAQIQFGASVSFSGHITSAFVNFGEISYFGCHNITFTGAFTGRKYYGSDTGYGAPLDKLESIPGSLEGVWTNPCLTTPQGRLTASSTDPCPAADQTAKTTLYYLADIGDYGAFSINHAATYEMATIGAAGLSLALNTSDHLSGKNYDVLLFRKTTTGEFLIGSSPAWTSDTARSAAVSRPNAVLANTAAMTVVYNNGVISGTQALAAGEGVVVGGFRCSANGQTEDSVANRLVWNLYNRRSRPVRAILSGTHPWSTASWQEMATACRVSMFRGLDEDGVTAHANQSVVNSSGAAQVGLGIGVDSTSAVATGCVGDFDAATSSEYRSLGAHYAGLPGLGFHYVAGLELGAGSGTQTWGNANVPFGLVGEVMA